MKEGVALPDPATEDLYLLTGENVVLLGPQFDVGHQLMKEGAVLPAPATEAEHLPLLAEVDAVRAAPQYEAGCLQLMKEAVVPAALDAQTEYLPLLVMVNVVPAAPQFEAGCLHLMEEGLDLHLSEEEAVLAALATE